MRLMTTTYLAAMLLKRRSTFLTRILAYTSSDMRLDYGKFYASKTFFGNAKKRRILWGWINESDSPSDDIEKGWSGLQSIPRTIWLSGTETQLLQWPIKEIETLRENRVSLQEEDLPGASGFEVSGIKASQVDVKVSFKLPRLEEAELMDPSWVDPQLLCSEKGASIAGRVGPFGLLVLASKNLEEQTAIFFRVFKEKRWFQSSLWQDLDKTTYGAFVDVDPNHEKLSLRTLIDHSVVESFGGEGRTCITARVYPRLAINSEAHLYAFNNGTSTVRITELSAWSMKQAQIK
ncbi:hypothetical protein GIB67_004517 [Kingdonia uniflora]|uniref:Beta-fructofuranosidase n=1 Tax=Kingdonia uniflora TaxID=39325 RepID=A0A7J7LSL1_9MAGN|nr:hypothetical protein GIB67_004517 [Kingdonia uniflora]